MRRMTLPGGKAARDRRRTGGLAAATGIAATLSLTGCTLDPQAQALLDGLLEGDGADHAGMPSGGDLASQPAALTRATSGSGVLSLLDELASLLEALPPNSDAARWVQAAASAASAQARADVDAALRATEAAAAQAQAAARQATARAAAEQAAAQAAAEQVATEQAAAQAAAEAAVAEAAMAERAAAEQAAVEQAAAEQAAAAEAGAAERAAAEQAAAEQAATDAAGKAAEDAAAAEAAGAAEAEAAAGAVEGEGKGPDGERIARKAREAAGGGRGASTEEDRAERRAERAGQDCDDGAPASSPDPGTKPVSNPVSPTPTAPATPAMPSAPSTPSAPAPTGQASQLEQQFFDLLNAERAEVGLPPLRFDAGLQQAARNQAAAVEAAGRLYHQDLGPLLGLGWRTAGENVGEGPTVSSLHEAFVASPGHYRNIVNANFTHLGVGVEVTADGRIWVAFVFGG